MQWPQMHASICIGTCGMCVSHSIWRHVIGRYSRQGVLSAIQMAGELVGDMVRILRDMGNASVMHAMSRGECTKGTWTEA